LTDTVDPFCGSYFVEALTRDLEREARAYFEQIDRRGGMIAAIEDGYPQREIAESAYRFQQAVESKAQVIVGVNEYVEEGERSLDTLSIDEAAATTQVERLKAVRAARDSARAAAALGRLRDAAGTPENLMPLIIDAVRAYATLGEMCDALRTAWGEYQELPTI
jgi:methylmalonyl-CoA mutase N-terminal domain/subunit